jgi:hypothetical protein
MKIEKDSITYPEGMRYGVTPVKRTARLNAGDRVETHPHGGTFGKFKGVSKGGTIVIEWERPDMEQLQAMQSVMRATSELLAKATSGRASVEQLKAIREIVVCLAVVADSGQIGLVSYVEEAQEALNRLAATQVKS